MSNRESVKVDDGNIPLYVSLPESGGPVPGIVVVHGQSGLEDFIKDTTHMLALQGYAAVAPNLYHRDGPSLQRRESRAQVALARSFDYQRYRRPHRFSQKSSASELRQAPHYRLLHGRVARVFHVGCEQ